MHPTFERRRIVGVMGSGAREFAPLAEAAGRVIAEGGYHLLTGGGGGVMAAAARAFTAVAGRAGLSIGIVRADGEEHLGEEKTSRRYRSRGPNPWVEIPILTHLPYSGERGKHALSRNHVNVLTADAVVVLPGESGTASELELALEYGRPLILFIGGEKVAGNDARSLRQRHGAGLRLAESAEDLAVRLRQTLGAPAPGAGRKST